MFDRPIVHHAMLGIKKETKYGSSGEAIVNGVVVVSHIDIVMSSSFNF